MNCGEEHYLYQHADGSHYVVMCTRDQGHDGGHRSSIIWGSGPVPIEVEITRLPTRVARRILRQEVTRMYAASREVR